MQSVVRASSGVPVVAEHDVRGRTAACICVAALGIWRIMLKQKAFCLSEVGKLRHAEGCKKEFGIMLVSVVDNRAQRRRRRSACGGFPIRSSDARPQVLSGSESSSPHDVTA